ncbi:MAG: methylenetetrahydrofolate reductase [Candidatus Omnitrophica bacterium]|nr:methylenetetrahydrofolate reductase [Candidatus Omnitrophota bacterium]
MNLKKKLEQGQFVVTSEVAPPKGTDTTALMKEAHELAAFVDAINVTDNQRAIMRAASLVTAYLLLREGIEPIYQLTVRDRNRLALQSDLLGASLLGITNILALSGDPPHVGDHPDTKGVYDLDLMALIRAAKKLGAGEDLGGNKLEGKAEFFVAAAANPGAADLEVEMSKCKAKVEAGADFFQTQAVYEAASFEKFIRRSGAFKKPVLAGIIPVKNAKMARYMNEKVPGIHVPETIIEAMDKAADKEEACVEITARIIRDIKPLAQGIHIMPIGWTHLVPKILERAEIFRGPQEVIGEP